MRTLLTTSLAVLGTGLALSAPASAFKPSDYPFTDVNAHAVEACQHVVTSQAASVGGGPKADNGAPANCDHFWQAIGAIGSQK
jgi:hypothetical protein